MASSRDGPEVTSEQREIIQMYGTLKQDLQELYSKIAEIDGDRSEHELVLSQLNGLDSSRRCWQQVGEALTETTIGAVVPMLDEKKKNIEQAIASLSEEVTKKEAELADIQKKYNIRERQQGTVT